MTSKDFLDQMDARIAKYDLLCHPFYKAWAAGELTPEDLREYGRDYFHQVEQFPQYLEEFAARVEEDQLRRAVLVNREEELGLDGSGSHAELWLDFVEGMGGGRKAGGRVPVAEITALTGWFHSVAGEGAPAEALAAFYAYESQVPRVAAEKARGLRERYGADEKTCRYFTLHVTADVDHSRTWKQQLSKLVNGSPERAEQALNAGEKAAQALWQALDGIEAARVARVAV